MDSIPVSICIPVRNEERNLPFCLESLSEFGEVVVVDSESTDNTQAIAQQAGATLLQFQWDGHFPKKRNWVIQNHKFRHPWVLFLDADERLTPEFKLELKQTINSTSHSGFWISYTNWFMDRPLRHGDVFRKLALFRPDKGRYEKLPEAFGTNLDMEVHEHPVLQGTIGMIKARIEHRDYRGLKKYLDRHNEYSSWEANRFLWFESADASKFDELTSRQRFKYRYLDRIWFAWFYWFTAVILKGGILDGRQGLTLGRLKRHYFEEIRLKILEARRTGRMA